MKKSVKVLMVVVIAFLGFTSQAQIFGVKGGIGLANISSPDQDIDLLFGRALGVRLGGTIEFDITDNLYIGSGLGFAKKGASTAGEGNFNLFYVELPASARYDILEIGGSGYLYASTGFNLGVMVSANNAENKLNIGSTNQDNFKALDLGANFGVGAIFDDRFEVGIVSEFGLFDISTTNSSNLKNISLMVSFGYKFGM